MITNARKRKNHRKIEKLWGDSYLHVLQSFGDPSSQSKSIPFGKMLYGEKWASSYRGD